MKHLNNFNSFKNKMVVENIGQRDSVEEFVAYVEDLKDEYPDEEFAFILSVIVNDENSSDDELRNYFLENEINPILIDKLLLKRNYFLDFTYSQHISA